ncbi:hypothetical protein DFJ74DRAFT_324364 [Hyaloraphidium curvatum]|nr:hypothetical protein DFJ74DRAFT_324364 [Hyaloraphidium curvatum]
MQPNSSTSNGKSSASPREATCPLPGVTRPARSPAPKRASTGAGGPTPPRPRAPRREPLPAPHRGPAKGRAAAARTTAGRGRRTSTTGCLSGVIAGCSAHSRGQLCSEGGTLQSVRRSWRRKPRRGTASGRVGRARNAAIPSSGCGLAFDF